MRRHPAFSLQTVCGSLVLSAAVLLSSPLGCGSDPSEPPPTPMPTASSGTLHQVELAPGSVWLDSESGFTVREVADTSVTVEVAEGTAPPAAGAVVIISSGAGSVRRVRSASMTGHRLYTLATEPAALSDAFSALRMDISMVLDADSVEGAQREKQSASTTAGSVSAERFKLEDTRRHLMRDLAGTVVYQDEKVRAEIVSGQLEVWATLAGGIDLTGESDLAYDLDVKSTATVKVTVFASTPKIRNETLIPGADWFAILRLGRVSTVLKLKMLTGYTLIADAATSLTATYGYQERVSGRVKYSTITGACSGVKPTRTRSETHSNPVIVGQVNGQLEVHLKPLVELQLLGTTGVGLSTEASARLLADRHVHPTTGKKSWGLVYDTGAEVALSTFPDRAGSAAAYEHAEGLELWKWEEQRRLVWGHVIGNVTGVSLTLAGEAEDYPQGPYHITVDPDANGLFVFEEVPKGTATIKPADSVTLFEPEIITVIVVNADLGDQDLEVQLVIEPVPDLAWKVGIPDAYCLKARGGKGTGKYTWSATGLPPGVVFETDAIYQGLLRGAAEVPGTFNIKVTAKDDRGSEGGLTIKMTVTGLVITNLTMAPATEGVSYQHAFGVTGGAAPYTWIVTGLPDGLTFNPATGEVSGTPGAGTIGKHTIGVDVTDATQTFTPVRMTELEVVAGSAMAWTDPATGLMWQQKGAGPGTHAQAETHCNNLILASHDDWRLPTLDELRTLVRGCAATFTGGSCIIPPTKPEDSQSCVGCSENAGPAAGCYWPTELAGPFASVCGAYWSSTLAPNGAYRLSFSQAMITSGSLTHSAYRRCVRKP